MTNIESQICDRLCRLKNYVNFRVTSRVEAEDIYGDTVLKIWKLIRNGKFREGFSLDAFMWLCAKSTISDYYKKENNGWNRDKEYAYQIPAFEKSPERKFEIKEENKRFIKKAKKELNDICRKVLILLLFQNMKHYEIADTLSIPRNTVSTYLFRMRGRLGDVYLNQARVLKKEA